MKNKEVKGMFLNVNMGVFYQITEVFKNSCMKRVPHTLLWQFFSYALIVGDFPFLLERLSWRTWFIKREARIRLFSLQAGKISLFNSSQKWSRFGFVCFFPKRNINNVNVYCDNSRLHFYIWIAKYMLKYKLKED